MIIVRLITLARDGVSREVPCSALKGETVPDSLPATPKSPPTRRLLPARELQGLWAPAPGRDNALEKEMATHCSVLAWRIPGAVEPGGLPSMGSHRVGHT